MGYYDKGSYGRGSYNPDEERQGARDRYLELLSKQRMGEQAMTDRMEREAKNKQALIAEEEQEESGQNAGDMAARGGQGAYAASGGNPIAAVVGTVIGKGVGAVQHGKKYGAWEGAKAFLNPFSTPKAMLGFGGKGAQGAGAGVANQVAEQNEDAKRDRLAGQLEMQRRNELDNQAFDNSTGAELNEPGLGDSLNDDPNARPMAQGDLYLDDEFAPDDDQRRYYGRYGGR